MVSEIEKIFELFMLLCVPGVHEPEALFLLFENVCTPAFSSFPLVTIAYLVEYSG